MRLASIRAAAMSRGPRPVSADWPWDISIKRPSHGYKNRFRHQHDVPRGLGRCGERCLDPVFRFRLHRRAKLRIPAAFDRRNGYHPRHHAGSSICRDWVSASPGADWLECPSPNHNVAARPLILPVAFCNRGVSIITAKRRSNRIQHSDTNLRCLSPPTGRLQRPKPGKGQRVSRPSALFSRIPTTQFPPGRHR